MNGITAKKAGRVLLYIFLIATSAAFLAPIIIVLYNSFKGKFFISDDPFALPNAETFSGIENYIGGIEKTGFPAAFGCSLFITVFSVAAIVLFTSMTAWYIVRVKNKFTKALYYIFVFSMIVPFQMVMFTMTKTVADLGLDKPWGLIIVYLGFGAGLAVFMFCGFVKSVPVSQRRLRLGRYGCNDGNACAFDYTYRRFLSLVSEIYYQGHRCRSRERINYVKYQFEKCI